MTDKKLVRRWLSVFEQNVPKEIMDNHVTTDGNHMWHIFTWGNVPCLEGDAARAAFDQLQDIEVIQFYGGYDCEIKRVSIRKKRTAKALDRERYIDIYVVAKDFSWTYVHTHEPDFGPYFYSKESPATDLSYRRIKQTNENTNTVKTPVEPFRADLAK